MAGKGCEMMGKASGREGEDRAHDWHGKAAKGQHRGGRGGGKRAEGVERAVK